MKSEDTPTRPKATIYNRKEAIIQKRKEYKRKYDEENKEKIKEYAKAYYRENKDKINQVKKDYIENNREKYIERIRVYNSKRVEYRNEYYQANKERRKTYAKEYYQTVMKPLNDQRKPTSPKTPKKTKLKWSSGGKTPTMT